MAEVRSKVARLDRHPRRVLERIRTMSRDLSEVHFSDNINALVMARVVSMRDIWDVLEYGALLEEWLIFDPYGTFGKLQAACPDGRVTLDFRIAVDENSIEVLFATMEVI